MFAIHKLVWRRWRRWCCWCVVFFFFLLLLLVAQKSIACNWFGSVKPNRTCHRLTIQLLTSLWKIHTFIFTTIQYNILIIGFVKCNAAFGVFVCHFQLITHSFLVFYDFCFSFILSNGTKKTTIKWPVSF